MRISNQFIRKAMTTRNSMRHIFRLHTYIYKAVNQMENKKKLQISRHAQGTNEALIRLMAKQ